MPNVWVNVKMYGVNIKMYGVSIKMYGVNIKMYGVNIKMYGVNIKTTMFLEQLQHTYCTLHCVKTVKIMSLM